MMCDIVTCLLWFVIAYVIFQHFQKNSQPLYGIYQQKGKWFHLKFALFYLFLRLRKMNILPSQDLSGYGIKQMDSVESMEKVQPLGTHPKAVDAVFFNGANRDGFYFAMGFARRQNSLVNGLVILRIPKVGLFLSPHLPDTTLKADGDAYVGEGISIEPVKAMRHWKVNYHGRMKHADDPNNLIDVKISFDWKTHLHYFDFNTDVSLLAVARATANESWSRDFFEDLKRSHQNHYEQMGNLEGQVEIKNVGKYDIRLNSMRDHSISKIREWKNFHRYILHYVTVEDGTRFMVGIISIPMSFSILECGYVYQPSGAIHPVDSVNLPLWFLGEYGEAPINYGFVFEAGDKTYQVQVEIVDSTELYFGLQWEARILERMGQFTVNGKKAWGITEWQYRNYTGKPDAMENK